MSESRLDRLIAWYKQALFVGFNFLLIFAVFWTGLNLALYGAFRYWDKHLKRNNPIVQKYGGIVQDAYPGWPPKELDILLQENWTRPLESDFVLMLRESAYRGKYVNVDPNGFRMSAKQGPWPPDRRNFNLFFFGGSTGFGYGVADEDTVASQLGIYLNKVRASKKPVKVYNFGRAGYYSTTERLLFERLLQEGFIPDLAVFMDGLNEFEHASDTDPAFLRTVDRWAHHPGAALVNDAVRVLIAPPIVRLQQSLRTGYLGWQLRGKRAPTPMVPISSQEATAITERYKSNYRLISSICAGYHIDRFFVWQPISFYKYDLKYSVMSQLNPNRQAALGYDLAAQVLKDKVGPNFLWIADMQDALGSEKLYVDSVHYSAFMSQKVAEAIGSALVRRASQPASR